MAPTRNMKAKTTPTRPRPNVRNATSSRNSPAWRSGRVETPSRRLRRSNVIPNSLSIKTTNDTKKENNENNSELYSLTVENGKTDSVVFKFSTVEEGDELPVHGYTIVKDKPDYNRDTGQEISVETDGAFSIPQAGPSSQPDSLSPKKSNWLTVSTKDIEESIGSMYLLLVPLSGNTGRRSQAVSRRRNNRAPSTRASGRNRETRRQSRRRSRRRRVQVVDVGADTDSDGVSSYDVEEVQYEELNDKNVPKLRNTDWRVFPSYQLTSSEAIQQEAELYQSFIKDKCKEGVEPVKDETETACCVCYDNKATRVVIPCGHLCLCYDCAYNMVMSRAMYYGSRVPKFCPICQAAVALLPKVCK